MSFVRRTRALAAGCALLACATLAQAAYVTCGGNNQRTAWTGDERALSHESVASPAFRKLWSVEFDGATYASPLFLEAVAVDGKPTNLLIGVSTRNSIYAVDAASGRIAWSHLALESADEEEGAYSVPVYDAATGTVYLLTRTLDAAVASFKLWAFDAATGARRRRPLEIDARAIPGFPAAEISSRGGLLLQRGKLYVAFGGGKAEVSSQLYHGAIVEVDVSAWQRAEPRVFFSTQEMRGGGLWGDCGVAADLQGRLWAATANCNGDIVSYWMHGRANYCQSILSLALPFRRESKPQSLYTPANLAWLDNTDQGFCTSPVVLSLPSSPVLYVAAANKDGFFYLANGNDPTGALYKVQGSRLFLCGQMALFVEGDTAWFYSMGRGADERDALSGVVAFSVRFTGRSTAEVDARVAWRHPRPAITAINGLHGSSNGTRDPIVWTVASERDAKGETVSHLAAYHAIDGTPLRLGGSDDRAALMLPAARRYRAPTVAASRVFVPARGIVAFGLATP